MAGSGIPGLVSPRFPGAGSPRSLRGVIRERLRREGLPRAANWSESLSFGGARGLGPRTAGETADWVGAG